MSEEIELSSEEARKLLISLEERERRIAELEEQWALREAEMLRVSEAIANDAKTAIDQERKRAVDLEARLNGEIKLREKLQAEKIALDNAFAGPKTPGSVAQRPLIASTPLSDFDVIQKLNDIHKSIKNLKSLSSPSLRENTSLTPSNIFLQEALDAVPSFDGSNVICFVRALKRAKSILTSDVQSDFIRLVRNKFQDHVFLALENREFESVDDLISRLKQIFSPAETLNNLRGKLDALCKKPSVPLLNYIRETLDIRDAILDRMHWEYGSELSQLDINRVENEVIEGFIDGLPPNFRSRLNLQRCKTLLEIFDDAIQAEKRFERDRAKHFPQGSDQRGLNSASRDTQQAASSQVRPDQDQSCNYCKQKGHVVRDCKKSKYYVERNQPKATENDRLARGRDTLVAGTGLRPLNMVEMIGQPGQSTQ